MLKRTFITLSIFCLIAFVSSPVFASNIMHSTENTLNNIRDGVQNMAQGAGNVAEDAKEGMQNMGNSIKNGAENMWNGAKEGIDNTGEMLRNTGNSVENDMRNDSQTNSSTSMTGTTDGGYTSTRTSGISQVTTSNTTMWVLLAAVAVAIIALIWYYVAQPKTHSNHDRF